MPGVRGSTPPHVTDSTAVISPVNVADDMGVQFLGEGVDLGFQLQFCSLFLEGCDRADGLLVAERASSITNFNKQWMTQAWAGTFTAH